MDTKQTSTHSAQHTLTVSKTTSREMVHKLTQFREKVEQTAEEAGSDLLNFYLDAGLVLLDICQILGLSEEETHAVIGESYAEMQQA